MAMSLRTRLLQTLPAVLTDTVFSWRHKRFWERQTEIHHEYFTGYQDRGPIVDAIVDVIRQHRIASPRVFEFGCSGGNNLRLLRERLRRPVHFTGIDIQAPGIAFARQKFPEDEFFVSSATNAADLPVQGSFDVFLASGVLLYLPQARAQEVLAMAAQVSRHQVFCDVIERFTEPRGTNDGTFVHPFGAMCAAAGLELVVPPFLPSPDSRLGVFVTRTATAAGETRDS